MVALMLALCHLGAPSLYAADTIKVKGINSNLMKKVTIQFNGKQSTVYAGALKGTFNGNNTYFFCYDLNHSIKVPGNYTVTVLNPASSSFPSNLLLPSAFNIQVATSMLNTTNLSAFTSVNQFTAMQLAIWTILYDWSPGVTPNLNTGKCKSGFCVPGASGALLANANMYLATARSFATSFPNGQSLGNWQLLSSMKGSHMNQVLIGVGTPEPGTYILLLSLLGFSLYWLKFKKNGWLRQP